jgi:hypothetical protein
MSFEERIEFERRAGDSPAFLERAREIGEVLAALGSVKVKTDLESLDALNRRRAWPERLKNAVQHLRELAVLAEKGAEAAIELTLDAVGSPVNTCIREGANLRFNYASGPVRAWGVSRPDKSPDPEKRDGSFATSRIANASVGVDSNSRTVILQFQPEEIPLVVVLIPEDPYASPLSGKKDPAAGTVVFENIPEGRYLLTIATSE